MNSPHIIVVGAGASGLACAIAAAESGASVSVFEAGPRPGRSIMASGNGRCNFCNADLGCERYNDPTFVQRAFEACADGPVPEVLGFFERLGLWHTCDEEGRYFPRSRCAASVLDVLLNRIDELGVRLWIESRVSSVARSAGRWTVELEDGQTFEADKVVWCAGGQSAGLLANLCDLELCSQMRVLCPIETSPKPARDLDGARFTCRVSVEHAGEPVFSEMGEVLMRKYGVSGIVVFDASRYAHSGDRLSIDLAPEMGEDELRRDLLRRVEAAEASGDVAFARLHLLDGTVQPKVAAHLMERVCGRAGDRPCDVDRLCGLLKRWEFRVESLMEGDQAQVTRGGIATSQVDPLTFAYADVPGLFICGEALDVDGMCGGLNLAWAWVSGMHAGRASAVS
ncbi:MAG: aminoacetone oxidase family FAD-binding enzyme [Coriobacteriaceae bacterium]|nr:aminoacetone oxidase family FAD-binding enzyme [Coriobacteriaceae bacterium]MDY5809621.1 aminoacetone oxidase family FAD-binding enzyme [Coriobacteriales bacterium]